MKPIVTTFAFSNDVKQQTMDGNVQSIQVIDPQNVFRPTFIPGTFSFAVTFGVLGLDPDKKNVLRFEIKDPNEVNVVETPHIDIPPNINFDDSILPKESNGFIFNMDFRNIAFRLEGKYTAYIHVNHENIGGFPVLVYPQERL
ncbi:hypothetical protein [Bacillus cihuensis]|uniref:hypothetical protein n=1 Tax=Bacillus cihuensis TaxID=1208599 RepID=UPI00041D033F|nr:hypothetical protein [Bacillus cihuensis]